MKHENNGRCAKCQLVLNRYPGFHKHFRNWFESFQLKHPEAHTSCAGRGELDQEACFIRKASRARWKESSHNYNAALDFFELGGDDIEQIYEEKWFHEVLAPELPEFLEWYGAPNAPFKEMPHVQLKNWKILRNNGTLKLVE